jgi:membrane-associated phospholipid phosphatase
LSGAARVARSLVVRVWPEEWLAVGYLSVVATLFAVRGLPFTVGPLAAAYGIFLGTVAGLALAPWALLEWWRRRRPGSRTEPRLRDLVLLARGLFALLVVLIAYTNLKSRLFVLHPTLYDRELGRVDAWVHFGGGDFLGWVLSTTHRPFWMAVLDLVYFYAWLPLALPFAVSFARAGGGAARRVLAALGLVYVAGSLLYLAIPSVGPAFFERARFSHLSGLFGWTTQESMLEALERVAAYPDSPAIPFYGLAAFPSLHLASTGLGLAAAWRWCRPLLWLLVPWNLLIAWATVAWGWHYAIDLYPGLLLAWGAWIVAGRLLPGARETANQRAGDVAGTSTGSPQGRSPATSTTR